MPGSPSMASGWCCGGGVTPAGGARPLSRAAPAPAFIDDQPASVGLLKQIGERLVEIQGQFEQQGLLDPATHRQALDAYAGHRAELGAMAKAWHDWRGSAKARDAA